MNRQAVPARPSHRYGVVAAVVAAVILLGSAALLLRAFSPQALGAPLSPTRPVAQPDPTTPRAADGLDPELQRRFDAAEDAASADGVTLTITSGWRTAAEQEQIIATDVATYRTAAEAHRWVLPPEKSAHVQGLAIDVGPTAGATWLAEHGAHFGLCRTYANETWHFEPVTKPGGGCPPMHQDSSWGW